MHGCGLFHSINSYNGQIVISITACRDMMPDPSNYADCLRAAFEELDVAFLSKKPSKPARKSPRRKSAAAKRGGAGKPATAKRAAAKQPAAGKRGSARKPAAVKPKVD